MFIGVAGSYPASILFSWFRCCGQVMDNLCKSYELFAHPYTLSGLEGKIDLVAKVRKDLPILFLLISHSHAHCVARSATGHWIFSCFYMRLRGSSHLWKYYVWTAFQLL